MWLSIRRLEGASWPARITRLSDRRRVLLHWTCRCRSLCPELRRDRSGASRALPTRPPIQGSRLKPSPPSTLSNEQGPDPKVVWSLTPSRIRRSRSRARAGRPLDRPGPAMRVTDVSCPPSACKKKKLKHAQKKKATRRAGWSTPALRFALLGAGLSPDIQPPAKPLGHADSARGSHGHLAAAL